MSYMSSHMVYMSSYMSYVSSYMSPYMTYVIYEENFCQPDLQSVLLLGEDSDGITNTLEPI